MKETAKAKSGKKGTAKSPPKPAAAKKTPTKKTPTKPASKAPAPSGDAVKSSSSKNGAKAGGNRTAKMPAAKPTAKKPPTKAATAKAAPTKATPAKASSTKAAPAKATSATKAPFSAYKGTRPYIFVSYSHKDMAEVFAIIKKLSESRYRLWYDEGIEPGVEWPEVVGKALVGCSQLLVFMSRTAAVSRNVRNEINLAFSEGKGILVVHLEKAKLTEGMKLQIGTMQFLNKYEMNAREFVEKLKSVLSNELRN